MEECGLPPKKIKKKKEKEIILKKIKIKITTEIILSVVANIIRTSPPRTLVNRNIQWAVRDVTNF